MTAAAEASRVCRTCSLEKPVEEFYKHQGGRRAHCKACMRAQDKERYKANNGKDRVFDQSLRRLYGITLDEYHLMADKQQHLCGLCGEPPTTQKRMHVDHDHVTGKIRALLCHHCNLLIGNARESVARLRLAITYLERHQADNHPAYALAAKLGERLQPEEEE